MTWLLSVVLLGLAVDPAALSPTHDPALLEPARVPSATELLVGPRRRVRSNDPQLAHLLSDGARRSRTFAQLVTRVHATDLIVYVESTHSLPPDTVGRLQLQSVVNGCRYLRVQVKSTLLRDEMIAVIGHELRHALEVADDPTVLDNAALRALYKRIGYPAGHNGGFDTDAAKRTGFQVRDELAS
jgi:hypothetical protein